MLDCWRSDPHARPNFGDVLLTLQNAGSSEFVYVTLLRACWHMAR